MRPCRALPRGTRAWTAALLLALLACAAGKGLPPEPVYLPPPAPAVQPSDAGSSFKVSTIAIVLVAAVVNAAILGISLRIIVLRYRREHRFQHARMLDQQREAARQVRRTPIQRITPTIILHPGSTAPSMGLKQAVPAGKGGALASHWTTEVSPFFSVDVQRVLAEDPSKKAPPAVPLPAGRSRLKGSKRRSEPELPDPKLQPEADGSDAV